MIMMRMVPLYTASNQTLSVDPGPGKRFYILRNVLMIDTPWPQIGHIAAPRGRAYCYAGMLILLAGLLPDPAAGQEAGDDMTLLAGTIKDPVFCPSDWRLVAYSRQVGDVQELYLYDTETRNVRQITAVQKAEEDEETGEDFFETDASQSLRRFEGQLAWRPRRDPDGRQWFVFVSSASEMGYGLFLSYLTPGGELATRTIELPFEGQAVAPTWSPDGNKLAFSGSPAGAEGNDLFLYPDLRPYLHASKKEDTMSSGPVPLTRNAGSLYPEWAPNEQYIAYQARRPGAQGRSNWGVSLLDLSTWAGPQSGTTPRSVRLSAQLDAYHEYKPNWSPNGAYVGFYVSQRKAGEAGSNRQQDIGVVELVRGSDGRRIQGGRILDGYTGARLTQNVLPSENRGPEWHPAETASALIYVRKEENKGNPIYLADVSRWRSNKSDFSQRISARFNHETLLHEEVEATAGSKGLRLAFASQVDKRLRLQIQSNLRPTYGMANAVAELNRIKGPHCRIQFSARTKNDENLRGYGESINNSLKYLKVETIKIKGSKYKYRLVSELNRNKENKNVLERKIKKIEKSSKMKEVLRKMPMVKCYNKEWRAL